MRGMDEVDQPRLQPGATKAVCAHIGIGSDEREARIARDRLDRILAAYRMAFQQDLPTTGTPAAR
ncbi:hypothetical protein SAMN05421805_1011765 [Saccharopolyspora antimicrobica]|uniref:Uncharacterized protein n=2 Tax=Saccharopolyspora antimicrobica TaxID=455193 RepID=A0A1I4U7P1_9PSEU|nr:hypothetical protein ATL45_7163 [Saccharopolyspora antimicrobica]SFM85008.1 hypothetical protein SAMN05421805_1011765 [Saccharopolyspora antimicrobica]